MGRPVARWQEAIQSARRTGLGVWCRDPEAGAQPDVPKGTTCHAVDRCLGCSKVLVIADEESVTDMIVWSKALEDAEPAWLESNAERWTEHWVPWKAFFEVVLNEKMTRGVLATIKKNVQSTEGSLTHGITTIQGPATMVREPSRKPRAQQVRNRLFELTRYPWLDSVSDDRATWAVRDLVGQRKRTARIDLNIEFQDGTRLTDPVNRALFELAVEYVELVRLYQPEMNATSAPSPRNTACYCSCTGSPSGGSDRSMT